MPNTEKRAQSYREMLAQLEQERRAEQARARDYADWLEPPSDLTPPSIVQTEFSMQDLLRLLNAAKLAMAWGMLAGLCAALGFFMLAVPHYRAHVVLAPANPISGAEAPAPAGNENWFALKLVMQQLSESNINDFGRFEQMIAGQAVAAALLQEASVRQGLTQDRALIFWHAQTPRNPAEMADYLRKRVRLEPVGATMMRRMVYLHPNPAFAAAFLQHVHHAADRIIRDNVRRDTQQRIDYLQQALSRTLNPDNQRALTNLLIEQERLRMLAAIEQPYAAAIIEPAAPSARSRWPDKPLMVAVLMALGAAAGLVVHAFRRPG